MRREGNINFVLVGARATGKTAYLTSLYLKESRVTADDSNTIDYLKPFADKLLTGAYPSATSGGLKELFFNYKDKKCTASIQIDDVDGYFIETLSNSNEETEKERNEFIRNLKLSEGIIFFFPYQKNFNEEIIKDFNYQIDSIISKLKKFYSKNNIIPIPSVIAISKWDNSPYFKREDEIGQAISFIEENEFLRLAKEKIDLNFSDVKIIPISAIGKDISSLEPYNLYKPLRFFLEKTYNNWVEKIESLKDNKEELFIFLSKIDFDMKFYNNGKYNKLYKKIEDEFAKELIYKANKFKTSEEINSFKKEKYELINALSLKNRETIDSIEKSLKRKKSLLNLRNSLIGVVLFAVAIFFAITKIDNREEGKIYKDILSSYKTHDYNKVKNDSETYMQKYKVQGVTEHIDKIKQIIQDIKCEEIINKSKKIINDETFDDTDKIELILNTFDKLGIQESDLRRQLLDKKSSISANSSYEDFENNLKHSTFIEAIHQVEDDWNPKFSTDKISSVITTLNIKFNKKVESLLKNISTIRNKDELSNLKNMITQIDNLMNRNHIEKIDYKPLLDSKNKIELDKNKKELKRYTYLLKNGVSDTIVSFKTKGGSENDDKLGFKCGEEDEIILTINSTKYHFDKKDSCLQEDEVNIMIWKNIKNIFKANIENDVKVIEEDPVNDDKYVGNFILNEDDLINIINHNRVFKDIGHSYFIEIESK